MVCSARNRHRGPRSFWTLVAWPANFAPELKQLTSGGDSDALRAQRSSLQFRPVHASFHGPSAGHDWRQRWDHLHSQSLPRIGERKTRGQKNADRRRSFSAGQWHDPHLYVPLALFARRFFLPKSFLSSLSSHFKLQEARHSCKTNPRRTTVRASRLKNYQIFTAGSFANCAERYLPTCPTLILPVPSIIFSATFRGTSS